MINLLMIFVYISIGIGFKNLSFLPKPDVKKINWFLIHICLPALALYHIPKIKWNVELIYPISVPWLGFLMSILFFNWVGKMFSWPKKVIGCLIITAGLSNTSFLGFPIIQALFGDKGLETAILVDQAGSFVVLSTLAVIVATIYSNADLNLVQMAKKVLFFPPFVTFVFAVLSNYAQIKFPTFIDFPLKYIGFLVTPLALFSVGMQLRVEKLNKHWFLLSMGLLYKLILTPLMVFLIYIVILGHNTFEMKVALMESAMAPMITGSILASTYKLKSKLSSMMIGFGIPISFISLMIWYFALKIL